METYTDTLSREIRTKWAAYRATGLAGLRQQVLDRLAALNVSMPAPGTYSDEWLGEYLAQNWRA